MVRGLAKAGIAAHAIHGNKSQSQRERVLAGFRTGAVRTLVATDIAARGIDVEGISHVVNYDLPNIPESYVHRIGRTARAGADGVAISFCDAGERAYLRDIETLIRMSIPSSDRRSVKRDAPSAHEAGAARPTHFPQHRKVAPSRNQHGKPYGRDANQRRQQPRQAQPQQPSRGAQRPQPKGGSDGSIASVAFLRHKQRPRGNSGGTRPPRQS